MNNDSNVGTLQPTVVTTDPSVVQTKAETFTDLSELFASDESKRIALKHPKTGLPLVSQAGGMAIWVTSADAPKCEEVKSEFAAKYSGKQIPYAANKQLRMDILVAATTRFENMVANDRELVYTPENAEAFYLKAPVIRKVLEEQIAFDELFMQGAPSQD